MESCDALRRQSRVPPVPDGEMFTHDCYAKLPAPGSSPSPALPRDPGSIVRLSRSFINPAGKPDSSAMQGRRFSCQTGDIRWLDQLLDDSPSWHMLSKGSDNIVMNRLRVNRNWPMNSRAYKILDATFQLRYRVTCARDTLTTPNAQDI